jgi:hypothetical protein
VLLTWRRADVRPRRALLPIAGAFAAVVILAAAQNSSETPHGTVAVVDLDGSGLRQVTALDARGEIAKLSVHDGEFELDPAELPLLGSPRAGKVALALVNYGCGHCRVLLDRVGSAVEAAADKELAVVLLPVGKSGKPGENHRILLALWRADREAYLDLSSRIATGQLPVKPDLIRAAAEEHLSAPQLDAALAAEAEWSDRQLDLANRLLAANNMKLERSRLPHLMVGDEIVCGAPQPAELYALLERNLGLRIDAAEATASALAHAPPKPAPKPAPSAVPAAPAFQPLAAPVADTPVGGLQSQFALRGVRRPSASLDRPAVNLGSIESGDVVRFSVRVRNSGAGSLKITALGRAPGCRVTSSLPLEVAPGHFGELGLAFDSAGTSGAVARVLKLASNAPEALRIELSADVRHSVALAAPAE